MDKCYYTNQRKKFFIIVFGLIIEITLYQLSFVINLINLDGIENYWVINIFIDDFFFNHDIHHWSWSNSKNCILCFRIIDSIINMKMMLKNFKFLNLLKKKKFNI